VNYSDLRQLIAQDLNRDDLSDIIDDYVKGRIEFYQKDFLYVSPMTEQISTVAGQALYALPVEFVGLDRVRLAYGQVWRNLMEAEYNDLLAWDVNIPPVRTIPMRWAPFGTKIRLWPVPNDSYQLELTGQGKVPAPTADTDTNFWTEAAATLIRYATTAQVRLLRLRDTDGFQTDMIAAERERLKLVQETTAKESNDIISAWW
jgi:hypothetical protein